LDRAGGQLTNLVWTYDDLVTDNYPTVTQFEQVVLFYPTSVGLSMLNAAKLIEMRMTQVRFVKNYYESLHMSVGDMGLRTMGQRWERMDEIIQTVPKWKRLCIHLSIRDKTHPRYIKVCHMDRFVRVRTSDVDPRPMSEIIDEHRGELGIPDGMNYDVMIDRPNGSSQNMRKVDLLRHMSPGSTTLTNRVVVVPVTPVWFQVGCLDGTRKTRIALTETVGELILKLEGSPQSNIFIAGKGDGEPLRQDQLLGTILPDDTRRMFMC